MKAHLFAFFLTLLSLPALAAEAPDACRYLKDVENKECAGLDEAALAALDGQAQKRKADVAKVYEKLLTNAKSDGIVDDKDIVKSAAAGADLFEKVEPPLNERTIPVWYPNDPQVIAVYRKWIAGVNDALRFAKDDKDNPVSPERRRQIDALLANNKVTLERMKGLKSADEFRCFVGDSCGSRGGVEGAPSGAAVFTAESGAGTDFAVGADKRPYRLQSSQPGGSLDKGTPAPDTSGAATEGGTTSKRAIAAASALVAAGLATGAAWLKKRKDDGQWADAQKEVAAQDPQSAAPAAETKPAVKAGPVNLNGYVPDPEEQRVINDLVKNAKRSSVDSMLEYINTKTNVGGYGHDTLAQAAERVGTMISKGQIVISPR